MTLHLVDARLADITCAVDRGKLAKVADADAFKATNNNVVAKIGKASVRVPVLNTEVATHGAPACDAIPAKGLLTTLQACKPFMDTKAVVGREWAASVRLEAGKGCATNAKSFIQAPAPSVDCAIPDKTVVALLKMPEPSYMGLVGEHAIAFLWDDGSWLVTKTLSAQWPDIGHILGAEFDMTPVPTGLYDAVAKVAKYGDEDSIIVDGGQVATENGSVTVPVEGMPDFMVSLAELSKIPANLDEVGTNDKMIRFTAGDASIVLAKLRV